MASRVVIRVGRAVIKWEDLSEFMNTLGKQRLNAMQGGSDDTDLGREDERMNELMRSTMNNLYSGLVLPRSKDQSQYLRHNLWSRYRWHLPHPLPLILCQLHLPDKPSRDIRSTRTELPSRISNIPRLRHPLSISHGQVSNSIKRPRCSFPIFLERRRNGTDLVVLPPEYTAEDKYSNEHQERKRVVRIRLRGR